MAKALRTTFVASLFVLSLLAGCPGKDGKDGATGAAGTNSLVQLTTEPPGANCANGGTRVQAGPDTDADGTLDAGEVTTTQYVCNGATGASGHDSLLAMTPVSAGTDCTNGGTRVQSGLDANDNGTLDAGEVATTQYVCNGSTGAAGLASLVTTTSVPVGDPNCAAGGVHLQSGVDANANGTLETGEVVLNNYVCNGAAGTNGTDGLNALIATAVEPLGSNCTWGGTRVDSGLDVNANTTLDSGEITATQYVCNGAPGLNVLVATSGVGAGVGGCAAGGTKVDVGLDADRDGIFDAGEGTATWYTCNGTDGTNGTDGLTSLVATATVGAGVGGCAAGGVQISTGLDTSGDGVLDPGEVGSSQYLCNGVNGTNGTDGTAGVTSLVALTSIPGPADCLNGGTRIQSGLDVSGDGILDSGEVASTTFVCNGAAGGLNSLVAMTQLGVGDATCPFGGTKIESGLDGNGNGTLDAGEVSQTQNICNGADGIDGFNALVATSPADLAACPFGGTKVESGIDASRDGVLDAGEVAFTENVCNGADGIDGTDGTSWIVTVRADDTGTCQFGGSRIDAGPDTNPTNGSLDAAEIASTAFACNGAAGAGLVTVMAFFPEPPGANCPYGGTRVDSGLDLNGNGLLDPGEETATGYVCSNDASHPTIARVSPPPGTAAPDANFCVTFSEAMDPATIDASNVQLFHPYGYPMDGPITYDPATFTACLDPYETLWAGYYYRFSVGEAGTVIRDLSGNQLFSKISADYYIVPPNLRVAIDAITESATPGVWDVAYTVMNTEGGAAGPFTVGFFIDRWPDVGYTPDASADFAGLAGYSSQSASIQITTGAFGTLLAYVDVTGAVAETNEGDNVGTLLPGVTGPIQVSASTVEEYEQLTVTVPVNATTRHVDLYLGWDVNSWGTGIGQFSGNYSGEGYITATFPVPAGMSGFSPVNLWAVALDETWSAAIAYAAEYSVSTVSLSRLDLNVGGAWTDTGIPLTWVTVTPSTRPNLTTAIVSVSDLGAGTIRIAYQVTNSGLGEAGASTLGLFLDPPSLPGVGWPANAYVAIPIIPAGGSVSATVDIPGSTGNVVVAYADLDGSITETDENDNLFVPRPFLTGPVAVDTTTWESGMPVTITVPVSPTVRSVNLVVGRDGYWWESLGSMSGNDAGQGFISGTFLVPTWLPYETASIWLDLYDAWGYASASYTSISWISTVNLATNDPQLGWIDSGIPQTYVTISPPVHPNLVLSVGQILPSGDGFDVTWTVTNNGYGDAGAFSVGFFVNPASLPAVGSPADLYADLPSLALSNSYTTTTHVTAPPGANLALFADVYGAVVESNEGDNLGLLRAGITGVIDATPSAVAEGGQLTVTVPVNAATRSVLVTLGTDYWWGWSTGVLAALTGNTAGEGYITGTVDIPMYHGLAGNTFTVWVHTYDGFGMAGYFYAAIAYYSGSDLMQIDPTTGAVGYTWIPLTWVSVTPPLLPDLRMRLLSIEPAAPGTYDVAFRVSNAGSVDAGPFTAGVYVDPAGDPSVGLPPDASWSFGGLAVGATSDATVNVTANIWSRIVGLVDVYDEVVEQDEWNNVGRLAPYIEGSPVVTPDPVELTGGITVTVPVNFSARSLQVELGGAWGDPTWWLGEVGGNYEGQGEISGTFSIPNDAGLLGTRTVIVTVWDDGHNIGRSYVYDPAQSLDYYSIYNASTGAFLSVSTFPTTTLSVVDATHPNLTLTIGRIVESAPGYVTVPFTVSNSTAFDAGGSTLGIYVDPPNNPALGDPPTATADIAPLPAWSSASGTVDVEATLVDRIVGLADALGAVIETNEWDNVAWPPPTLLGPIVATPDVVDEGTLLTVTLPVGGSTFHAEVYMGDDMDTGSPVQLGFIDGNWENQGYLTGTLMIPPGTAGWVPSIWVLLYDDGGQHVAGYGASSSVSLTNLAVADAPAMVWTDSGIPLTFIQIIPWSRPNLQVSIDQVDDMGDGTSNVTWTVVNVGASAANGFDVGFYVDPPSIPGVGSPTSALITGLSLDAGATYNNTVNLTATGIPAIFAYADAGGVIDEQSETDNLAWKLPAAAMTGSPVPSVSSVAEGGSFDVTVPVSPIVRSIDVYIGAGDMMANGPAFKIGSANGNAAGEGTITATCTVPPGSAGDWTIWVATFDLYGLEWRGYGQEAAMSTVYYTEWLSTSEELRPTTIPLTALTVTP